MLLVGLVGAGVGKEWEGGGPMMPYLSLLSRSSAASSMPRTVACVRRWML